MFLFCIIFFSKLCPYICIKKSKYLGFDRHRELTLYLLNTSEKRELIMQRRKSDSSFRYSNQSYSSSKPVVWFAAEEAKDAKRFFDNNHYYVLNDLNRDTQTLENIITQIQELEAHSEKRTSIPRRHLSYYYHPVLLVGVLAQEGFRNKLQTLLDSKSTYTVCGGIECLREESSLKPMISDKMIPSSRLKKSTMMRVFVSSSTNAFDRLELEVLEVLEGFVPLRDMYNWFLHEINKGNSDKKIGHESSNCETDIFCDENLTLFNELLLFLRENNDLESDDIYIPLKPEQMASGAMDETEDDTVKGDSTKDKNEDKQKSDKKLDLFRQAQNTFFCPTVTKLRWVPVTLLNGSCFIHSTSLPFRYRFGSKSSGKQHFILFCTRTDDTDELQKKRCEAHKSLSIPQEFLLYNTSGSTDEQSMLSDLKSGVVDSSSSYLCMCGDLDELGYKL